MLTFTSLTIWHRWEQAGRIEFGVAGRCETCFSGSKLGIVDLASLVGAQLASLSPIVFAIYTSGLIKWVEESVTAQGLSFVDDLGWVATGSDVNHVVTIRSRCAPKSIEWASRRGLQFHRPRMEVALLRADEARRTTYR